MVDDEPQITRVLRTALAGHGYNVRTAGDGDEALEVMRRVDAGSGHHRSFHAQYGRVGVVPQNTQQDRRCPSSCSRFAARKSPKVEALDCGADDYVTKPFNMNELVARVRAGLRRAARPAQEESESKIEAGDFHIDLQTRLVTVRGRDIRLTPKEFDLLCYLAKNHGKVITHHMLLAAVWGSNSTRQPEYLHVFINHLRKKLEPEDGSVRYIVTEKWVGYRFEPGDLK